MKSLNESNFNPNLKDIFTEDKNKNKIYKIFPWSKGIKDMANIINRGRIGGSIEIGAGTIVGGSRCCCIWCNGSWRRYVIWCCRKFIKYENTSK